MPPSSALRCNGRRERSLSALVTTTIARARHTAAPSQQPPPGVGSKGNAKYGQFNLGSAYSLSKATGLYLIGAFQHAGGTDSLGRPAVAAIGYLTPSPTDKQVAVLAGRRGSAAHFHNGNAKAD